MMTGTLITDKNREFFLQAVDPQIIDEGDIFIGAIDDDTNTACGVLVAKEQADLTLEITYIYVAEEWRNKGAGTALIDTLREVADSLEAERIACTNVRGNDEDEVADLLEDCDFVKDTEQTFPIYRVNLADIELKDSVKSGKAGMLVSLKDITDKEWTDLSKEWAEQSGDEMCLDALKFPKENYNGEKSVISLGKKGKVNGIFLLSGKEGDYSLEAFGALGDDVPLVTVSILQNLQNKLW